MNAPTARTAASRDDQSLLPLEVRLLHRIALSGLPDVHRHELGQRWASHVADGRDAGDSRATMFRRALAAVASHTTHSAVTDPMLVPPTLNAISQGLGVYIIALLTVRTNMVSWPEMLPWLFGGSAAAVTALHASLRRRTWLLAATHAVGIAGCVIAIVAIEGMGPEVWLVRLGFANLIMVTVIGIAEWLLAGRGRTTPRALDVLLIGALYSSANIVALGLVVVAARRDELWMSAAALVLGVLAVFGSNSVVRLRQRHGTLFGPHAMEPPMAIARSGDVP